MDFEVSYNKEGVAIRYCELSFIEIEKALETFNIIDVDFEDESDYQAYIALDKGYVIIYHKYLNGVIFKSLKDYRLYEQHFSEPKTNQAKRAFVSQFGNLIEYAVVSQQSVSENINVENDGQVSIDVGEMIYIFRCENDLDEYRASLNRSVFLGCNPYRKQVLSNSSKIINELAQVVKLDSQELNFSINSLQTIDRKINELNWGDLFFWRAYLGLTLYLGETLIRNNISAFSWEVVQEEADVYVPYLLSGTANLIPIHIYIYESLKAEFFISSNLFLTYDFVKKLSTL